MSLTITNNVGALNARNNLNRSSNALNKSIERLSTGFKVNRGADGPAALVISEKQRAQIAGLRTAIDNTEKAVAVVQTAEGALNEINSILIKVRSLALDSANSGVNDADAFAANQAEIDNALDTINRIAANTQFGEKALLDGSAGVTGSASDADVTFLKGGSNTSDGTYAVEVTTAGERANITAGTSQTGNLAADEVLSVNGVSITLNSGLSRAGVVARINEFTDQTGVVAEDISGGTRLRSIEFGSDAEIEVVSDTAASATSSGFGTTLDTDQGLTVIGTIDGVAATGKGNTLTSVSGASKGTVVRIGEGSDAALTASGAQGNVSIQNNALVFQIGANQNQTAQISVQSVNADALGVAVTGSKFNSLDEIDVTSFDNAQDALKVIDSAIDELSNMRGELGAFQSNTLESIANNMRSTLENTVNAESVIRDTDFAEEISKFTNNQILVQAGTSVLSSANQTSQSVLSLLQ
ncbi:flagellin [Rhodopirellula sp. JC639]|uniref:flagellin N-terminal helical domain-containing protein n=1 Tax=Stieleria mannarensis TaxID=2755585 RepID=UPI001601A255|nr:flagellin [Rhodopirellula sp. JC639]